MVPVSPETTNSRAVTKIIGTPGSLLLAEWQKSRRPDQPFRVSGSESLVQTPWFRVSGYPSQYSRSGLSRQVGRFVWLQAVWLQAGPFGANCSVRASRPVSARGAHRRSQAQRLAPESSSRHYRILSPVTGPVSPFLSQRRRRSIPALPDDPADDDPRHCADQSSEGASDLASPRLP